MNRFFIPGEGRRDFPKRSYAKLDQVEPPNAEEARKILFAFDAVDADWPGFEGGQMLSLEDDPAAEARLSRFWAARFSPPDDRVIDGPDPFDALPMYRIDITLGRHDPLAEKLLGMDGQWFEIGLNAEQGQEVEVYGGLFMAAVPARLSHKPRPAAPAVKLERLFSMEDWPDATRDELEAVLGGVACPIERLLMFDIGQGSATALVCQCGNVISYFDVGCGVYRNAKTMPATVSFCTHEPPTVILSHWDADHWAGATVDKRLLAMTWVAPRQSISKVHKALGNDILKGGGRILIVPTALSPLVWGNPGQTFELRRCTGTDRNGSGLALIAEDNGTQSGWLLTGDAAYNYVPGPLPANLTAVAVPHHGADMGKASIPPASPHPGYARLLYSFGPANAHGRTGVSHPTAAAVAAHNSAGWPQGAWAPPPAAMRLAGQPVLATASHLTTHEQGIAVGWSGPPVPVLSGHAASCPDVMPVVQS
ncbi:metallo-hydrolase/oxidoreductase [Sphingomonas populi]|uniref:Metallo-hydrolase/oxidoreductase n=1 Tax=Sphingomonas populi TaxID=2484750 RepID=A0A4Q6XWI7_9SPHN|nr:metallo-hydrolase/oxidoreductase [Sphingomonas populi]RZF64321.1 metallo-hydrolase/oxidoreductase [Sphingomonas populi]